MTTSKPVGKSKTIWFNAIMTALSVAELNFGLLTPVLVSSTYGVLLFGLTAGNAVLRVVTNSPVTFKK